MGLQTSQTVLLSFWPWRLELARNHSHVTYEANPYPGETSNKGYQGLPVNHLAPIHAVKQSLWKIFCGMHSGDKLTQRICSWTLQMQIERLNLSNELPIWYRITYERLTYDSFAHAEACCSPSAILKGEGNAPQCQFRNYNLCLTVHPRISAGICHFNTKPFIQAFRQFPVWLQARYIS